MTHRAAGSGRRIPKIWLLPVLVIVAISAATYTGYFSRSLLLDLAAWWPVWLFLLILIFVARGRRIGKVRTSGLVPLMATAALGLFVYAHVAGWSAMPSASRNLVGPEVVAESSAALSARIDGVLVIGADSEHLYQVSAIRQGGDVGMAEAVEQTQGGAVSVALEEPAESGFYEFAGWDVELSPEPVWSLTLDGEVDADLAGLDISSIQLGGSGEVRLGATDVAAPVDVNGVFLLVIPDGVVARVVGKATVPTVWEQLSDGWRSPVSGVGWVISVAEGASLTVTSG
ncbi:MAG: hypothetical protein U9N56_08065 [Actinomycetota bacterium]|nr:hypothetical protein [Actinomycetota bacterium]